MYKPEIAAVFWGVEGGVWLVGWVFLSFMYQNLLLYLVPRVNVSGLCHIANRGILLVEQSYFLTGKSGISSIGRNTIEPCGEHRSILACRCCSFQLKIS